MSDWREMEAGSALDGFIEYQRGRWEMQWHDQSQRWVVCCEFGRAVEKGRTFGLVSEISLADPPAYSTSVDVALTLLPLDRDNNVFYRHAEHSKQMGMYGWNCTIHENHPGSTHANAETPALAICRAWLSWQESRSE